MHIRQAFQAIADANDDEFYPGTRAAGTEGYAESVEYVAGLLEDAGYNVTLDPFEFTFDFPVTIDQLTPVAASYPSGAFTGSGFGETTAAVTAVDVNLVPPRANTSGCRGRRTSPASSLGTSRWFSAERAPSPTRRRTHRQQERLP